MLLIEKIFKSNVLFLMFLAFIWSGIILIISEVIHHETVDHEIRGYVLQELDRMKANHATKEMVERRTRYRWHSYDMRIWCADAEDKNWEINWQCPYIGDIIDLTNQNEEE